jgi:dephospho-CoA kinase
MKTLGLTGSIGMGKSTTSALFAEAGVPVYDADAAVHAIYTKGGPAAALLEAEFPGCTHDGAVDRPKLSAQVLGNPEKLKRLEAIVHPLLAQQRAAFFETASRSGAPWVILDVPLLFETGGHRGIDAVVVVSAPTEVQRTRVLARPDMTPEKLDAILARQWPDAKKRALADFVIDTSVSVEDARRQVGDILTTLADPAWKSTRPLDLGDEAPHS